MEIRRFRLSLLGNTHDLEVAPLGGDGGHLVARSSSLGTDAGHMWARSSKDLFIALPPSTEDEQTKTPDFDGSWAPNPCSSVLEVQQTCILDQGDVQSIAAYPPKPSASAIVLQRVDDSFGCGSIDKCVSMKRKTEKVPESVNHSQQSSQHVPEDENLDSSSTGGHEVLSCDHEVPPIKLKHGHVEHVCTLAGTLSPPLPSGHPGCFGGGLEGFSIYSSGLTHVPETAEAKQIAEVQNGPETEAIATVSGCDPPSGAAEYAGYASHQASDCTAVEPSQVPWNSPHMSPDPFKTSSPPFFYKNLQQPPQGECERCADEDGSVRPTLQEGDGDGNCLVPGTCGASQFCGIATGTGEALGSGCNRITMIVTTKRPAHEAPCPLVTGPSGTPAVWGLNLAPTVHQTDLAMAVSPEHTGNKDGGLAAVVDGNAYASHDEGFKAEGKIAEKKHQCSEEGYAVARALESNAGTDCLRPEGGSVPQPHRLRSSEDNVILARPVRPGPPRAHRFQDGRHRAEQYPRVNHFECSGPSRETHCWLEPRVWRSCEAGQDLLQHWPELAKVCGAHGPAGRPSPRYLGVLGAVPRSSEGARGSASAHGGLPKGTPPPQGGSPDLNQGRQQQPVSHTRPADDELEGTALPQDMLLALAAAGSYEW